MSSACLHPALLSLLEHLKLCSIAHLALLSLPLSSGPTTRRYPMALASSHWPFLCGTVRIRINISRIHLSSSQPPWLQNVWEPGWVQTLMYTGWYLCVHAEPNEFRTLGTSQFDQQAPLARTIQSRVQCSHRFKTGVSFYERLYTDTHPLGAWRADCNPDLAERIAFMLEFLSESSCMSTGRE